MYSLDKWGELARNKLNKEKFTPSELGSREQRKLRGNGHALEKPSRDSLLGEIRTSKSGTYISEIFHFFR